MQFLAMIALKKIVLKVTEGMGTVIDTEEETEVRVMIAENETLILENMIEIGGGTVETEVMIEIAAEIEKDTIEIIEIGIEIGPGIDIEVGGIGMTEVIGIGIGIGIGNRIDEIKIEIERQVIDTNHIGGNEVDLVIIGEETEEEAIEMTDERMIMTIENMFRVLEGIHTMKRRREQRINQTTPIEKMTRNQMIMVVDHTEIEMEIMIKRRIQINMKIKIKITAVARRWHPSHPRVTKMAVKRNQNCAK